MKPAIVFYAYAFLIVMALPFAFMTGHDFIGVPITDGIARDLALAMVLTWILATRYLNEPQKPLMDVVLIWSLVVLVLAFAVGVAWCVVQIAGPLLDAWKDMP